MKTLHQCLLDYPLELLQAISELRLVPLTSHVRREAVEQLAAALAEPSSIAAAVASCSTLTRDALRELLRNNGRMTTHTFARRFGELRPFGPGPMARETPWRQPASASEELWYRALISRGFGPLGSGTTEFMFVPSDVLPHLPLVPAEPPSFELAAAAEPHFIHLAKDTLLEDTCTLLGLVQEKQAWVDHRGRWRRPSLIALNERLLCPAGAEALDADEGGDALSLLLQIVQSLNWLREERRLLHLQADPVRTWLQSSREAQIAALWTDWRDNDGWDDLCRIPGLRCEGTWRHSPLSARHKLLVHLSRCEPHVWYAIDEFAAAVKQVDPDFLRPDGDYRSWYVRDVASGRYLRGFQHWESVEGALIGYLLTGPAHWLGAVDLGSTDRARPVPDACSPSGAYGATMFRLTSTGSLLLGQTTASGAGRTSPRMTVQPDRLILAPHGTACFDRFRLAYFAEWQASRPEFRYHVTRESLQRAADQGISPQRILVFLRSASDSALPASIIRYLTQSEE
ncbi:MAG TPA: hypothetical protein VM537_36060 [Anaerolineae bacterium]|nr:hypothetical protein [Anaerolineae bacterium]